VLLRPSATPAPLVHVELDLRATNARATTWHLARGAASSIQHAVARDDAGDIAVVVTPAKLGADLVLARAPGDHARVAYDVLAGRDAPDDPLGNLVLDDRFRGAGEAVVALPDAIADVKMPVALAIDGDPLRAPGAASSLGVGPTRRVTLPPRALRYSTFLAGSLGVQIIDDAGMGHDEGAWLGYTAFDPRPAIAELAEIRTSMREVVRGSDDTPYTYLFMSQTRPFGSFTTTARPASVLVQLGPAEPWTAPLRVSIAQQLAHRWIGGEVRLATTPGHEGEGWWFADGVARWLAMHVLADLGLLSPDDAREAIAGELSVLATSPDRALGNAELAAKALGDDVARATLVARGALYATREAAVIRAKTKGARGLRDVLTALVHDAQESGKHAIGVADWVSAIGKDDPDAQASFDALVTKGAPIALPGDALGPCFRAGTGEYVAYDPGFDVEATRVDKDGRAIGVRDGGPAAKAGLKEGDVVTNLVARDGDASAPVTITVTRDGKKVDVKYLPRGAKGRGQTWTRIRGAGDDRCGSVI
jgi:hypothetical protein